MTSMMGQYEGLAAWGAQPDGVWEYVNQLMNTYHEHQEEQCQVCISEIIRIRHYEITILLPTTVRGYCVKRKRKKR